MDLAATIIIFFGFVWGSSNVKPTISHTLTTTTYIPDQQTSFIETKSITLKIINCSPQSSASINKAYITITSDLTRLTTCTVNKENQEYFSTTTAEFNLPDQTVTATIDISNTNESCFSQANCPETLNLVDNFNLPLMITTNEMSFVTPSLNSIETITTTVKDFTTEFNLVISDFQTTSTDSFTTTDSASISTNTEIPSNDLFNPFKSVAPSITTITLDEIPIINTMEITSQTPSDFDFNIQEAPFTTSSTKSESTLTLSSGDINIKPFADSQNKIVQDIVIHKTVSLDPVSSLGPKEIVKSIEYGNINSSANSGASDSRSPVRNRMSGRENYHQSDNNEIITWILGLILVGIFVNAAIVFSYDRLRISRISGLDTIATAHCDLESARNISFDSAVDSDEFNIEDVIANAKLYMDHSDVCDDESSVVSSQNYF